MTTDEPDLSVEPVVRNRIICSGIGITVNLVAIGANIYLIWKRMDAWGGLFLFLPCLILQTIVLAVPNALVIAAMVKYRPGRRWAHSKGLTALMRKLEWTSLALLGGAIFSALILLGSINWKSVC